MKIILGVSLSLVLLNVASASASAQTVLRVPQDKPTIQSAIDSSVNGNTINISPGLYAEQIDFHGKAITVQGTAGGVIIDAGLRGPVVTFNSGETRSSILRNVIVQNGAPHNIPDAGGILVNGASPTIEDSIIQQNHDCGIGVFSGAPLIQNNSIIGTTTSDPSQNESFCTGAGGSLSAALEGAGIQVFDTSSDGSEAQIIGNTVRGNIVLTAAIVIENAGRPLIQNNLVEENTGGGIRVEGDTAPTIVQNVIVVNAIPGLWLSSGPGIFASMPLTITNNTIAGNTVTSSPHAGSQSGQVLNFSDSNNLQFSNNLIIGTSAVPPIYCGILLINGIRPPTFDHNDVFGPSGLYMGTCSNQTGLNGNISRDALFASQDLDSANPFQLLPGSPAIDSGTNTALGLPQLDFLGQPRIQNATGSPVATVDMGVYEYKGVPIAVPPPPVAPAFTLTTNIASLTLQTEHHGTVVVTGTPLSNTAGTVMLSCAAPLPIYVSCTFQPTQFNLSGNVAKTAQLTIDTSAVPGYALHLQEDQGLSGLYFCVLLLPIGIASKRLSRTRSLYVCVAFVLSFCLSGCSGKLPASTPPGTYTITIVGADQTHHITESATITLVVTQ